MQNNPPTPPLTLDDLERLANDLALTQNDTENVINEELSVNAKRIMYRFWLRTDIEQEQALMQWLDIFKANRKFQTFVKLALRFVILDYFGHERKYMSYCDELMMQIEELMAKIDFTKE